MFFEFSSSFGGSLDDRRQDLDDIGRVGVIRKNPAEQWTLLKIVSSNVS